MSKRSIKGPVLHLGLAVVVAALTSAAVATSGVQTVRMEDNCDPTTFNAVLGDGACQRDEGTTFDEFLANTAAEGGDHHWRYKEDEFHVNAGEAVNSFNIGGEEHTFTPVARFGGGFVDILNDLSGAGPIVPECVPVVNGTGDLVAPGPVPIAVGHSSAPQVLKGTRLQRFQCCIHPWMRAEVTVRNR